MVNTFILFNKKIEILNDYLVYIIYMLLSKMSVSTTTSSIIAMPTSTKCWLSAYALGSFLVGTNVCMCIHKFFTGKFKKYSLKHYFYDPNVVTTVVGIFGVAFAYKKFQQS